MKSKDMLKMTEEQRDGVTFVLQAAIEVVGSQSEFARIIGTHQSQVNRWLRGMEVPAERAVLIERKLGVERELLRPDLFIK